MNNSRNKIIAVVTLLSIALASFGACKKKDNNAVSLTEEQIKTPFHYQAGVSSNKKDDDYFLGLEDPTESKTESTEKITEYQPVTDDAGEAVTTYIAQLDENGEAVTDTDGSTVTTHETVTTIVEKDPEIEDKEEYVPYTDRAYAMWLDISKNENFMFEDSFIKVTFKVKEDIPDGDYNIVISNPDFSSIMGQTVKPDKVINGKIYVNKEAEKQTDYSSETGLVVAGENISCKQGDEVTYHFSIKNNPGLAAMVFWFEYDGNAFEVIDCVADGEFAEVAKNTQTGTKKN